MYYVMKKKVFLPRSPMAISSSSLPLLLPGLLLPALLLLSKILTSSSINYGGNDQDSRTRGRNEGIIQF